MNSVSQFTARIMMRKIDTQTKRGREKVTMREIHEWSLVCHRRCSCACQNFASEHGNKIGVTAPLMVHPLIRLALSAVEGEAMKRTRFKAAWHRRAEAYSLPRHLYLERFVSPLLPLSGSYPSSALLIVAPNAFLLAAATK